MTERVEVTSADKIAAARIAHDGEWEVSVAEAFARHRQTAYRAGLEKAKEIADVYSSIHVEKRDDAMAVGQMHGALTKARQAQTCDEIAAAIQKEIDHEQ
jgi:hypothetical protein